MILYNLYNLLCVTGMFFRKKNYTIQTNLKFRWKHFIVS